MSDSLKTKQGHELEDGRQQDTIPDTKDAPQVVEEDGPWYLGKAKEEFRKRRTTQAPSNQGGEEDPIQVCPGRYVS